jgi:hypothetical protein
MITPYSARPPRLQQPVAPAKRTAASRPGGLTPYRDVYRAYAVRYFPRQRAHRFARIPGRPLFPLQSAKSGLVEFSKCKHRYPNPASVPDLGTFPGSLGALPGTVKNLLIRHNRQVDTAVDCIAGKGAPGPAAAPEAVAPASTFSMDPAVMGFSIPEGRTIRKAGGALTEFGALWA